MSFKSWRTRRRLQDWTNGSSLLSRLQHTDQQTTVNLTVFLSLKSIRNHILTAGLRPDPLGELERSPIPSIRMRGLGVREGMGREGMGKEAAGLYIIQSSTINASSYYLGTYRQIDAAFIVEPLEQ